MCYGKASRNRKRKCVVNVQKTTTSSRNCCEQHFCSFLQPDRAWIDTDIFENWFHRRFVPEVQYFTNVKALPQKSVFLLDNVPSHSSAMSSDNGLTTITYSPPFTLQPWVKVYCNCITEETVTGWPSQMTMLLH
jgi:hypothetical protein